MNNTNSSNDSNSNSNNNNNNNNNNTSGTYTQESIQPRLKTLIDTPTRPGWTYAVFWQYTFDDLTDQPMLSWGDGYYKGDDKHKVTLSSTSAEQAHRKHVLRELNNLIHAAESDADEADEDVTDTEWFFLISMTHSFQPGQDRISSDPVWVTGSGFLSGSPCGRAKQGAEFGLQTMVSIPVLNGVVELGSTELILRCPDLLGQVRALFGSEPGSGSSLGLLVACPMQEQVEIDLAGSEVTDPLSSPSPSQETVSDADAKDATLPLRKEIHLDVESTSTSSMTSIVV